jgi:hypothetical protein
MNTMKLTDVPTTHKFKGKGPVHVEVTGGSVNVNGTILIFGVQGAAKIYDDEKKDDTGEYTLTITAAVNNATSKNTINGFAPLS